MNVSGDTPGVDYVEYFTKQFPQDLARMAALRDELATRQGALSAAEAAVADRDTASKELTAAKSEAAAILAEAKDVATKTKEAAAAAKARETAVAATEVALADKVKTVEADLAVRLKACENLEVGQAKLTAELTARSEKLDADVADLKARVQAFQAKVAAISA